MISIFIQLIFKTFQNYTAKTIAYGVRQYLVACEMQVRSLLGQNVLPVKWLIVSTKDRIHNKRC